MAGIAVAEPRTVERKTSESRKLDGLCVTCEHAPTCVFAQSGIQPVVFCEEYDEEQVVNAGTTNMLHRQNRQEEPDFSLKGLCVNCANRKDCTHRKPVTGIWHCEDYA
ncbi:MAG: hypothetical protein KAT85_09775 [candidate division Zixibacteria bacterium]|nr:hypothetical protein [candidate division Zixibacteria bacterium]